MESIGSAHTTTEYSEGITLTKLSREDAYALDLLKRSGADYDMVDLSKGIGRRLQARLRGVRQTPALIDATDTTRTYVGVNDISRYVQERMIPKRN